MFAVSAAVPEPTRRVDARSGAEIATARRCCGRHEGIRLQMRLGLGSAGQAKPIPFTSAARRSLRPSPRPRPPSLSHCDANVGPPPLLSTPAAGSQHSLNAQLAQHRHRLDALYATRYQLWNTHWKRVVGRIGALNYARRARRLE